MFTRLRPGTGALHRRTFQTGASPLPRPLSPDVATRIFLNSVRVVKSGNEPGHRSYGADNRLSRSEVAARQRAAI